MKLEQKENALLLQVKVIPNAGKPGISGILGDALKLKVAQPPEEGRANRAVESLLATLLGVAPANVSVIAGHTRPRKTIRILGIPLEDARCKLQAALIPR